MGGGEGVLDPVSGVEVGACEGGDDSSSRRWGEVADQSRSLMMRLGTPSFGSPSARGLLP